MSRIRALMPQLQLVQPTSAQLERPSNWEDTISTGWQAPGSSWSVPEYLRTLQCSERSERSACDGSASPSSPFGSTRVN